MSIALRMKNPIFKHQNLYVMIRLSQIQYFPYHTRDIGADEVLTIFMRKSLSTDITIESNESEKGLTFSGQTYDIYKDKDKDKLNPYSPAWYISQISKWQKHDLSLLNDDLNAMRTWLEANDYVKDGLPTDKFLKLEFLEISDAAEERRNSRS